MQQLRDFLGRHDVRLTAFAPRIIGLILEEFEPSDSTKQMCVESPMWEDLAILNWVARAPMQRLVGSIVHDWGYDEQRGWWLLPAAARGRGRAPGTPDARKRGHHRHAEGQRNQWQEKMLLRLHP